MSDTLRIALLGAGQLGGSFILALREAGADIFVSSYDPAQSHAEALLANGAVDVISATPQEAAKGADIIVLASPLRTYRALVTAISPHVGDGAILTDLGSVKRTMRGLEALVPKAHLVPGHPIAGSEKSGPAAARADLFRDRLVILTPDSETDMTAFTAMQELWSLVGADAIAMPCEVHDQIYAYVSHLPHYIAFIAAEYFSRLGVHVGADEQMLQQFLRISHSNPRMWTDVALENREALLPALATYIALLEHFESELRMGAAQEAMKVSNRGKTGGVSLSPRERLGEGDTRADGSGQQRTTHGGQQQTAEHTLPSPLAALDPLPRGEGSPVAPLSQTAAFAVLKESNVDLAKALLPRVLASCLISSASLYEQQSGTNLRPFGGAGMRDIVAPAAVTPEEDTERMSNHARAMADLIAGIIPYFRKLESLIGAEDEPNLYAAVSAMVEHAHTLTATRSTQ